MFVHAPPGEDAQILFIVQFHLFPAAAHQLVGYFRVCDREIEHVGAYVALFIGAVLDSAQVPAPESGHDEPAFIGFENISLEGELVQFSGLYAVSENIEEADINEGGEGDDQDGNRPSDDFSELQFHDDGVLADGSAGEQAFFWCPM